jgi:hypothetical protein
VSGRADSRDVSAIRVLAARESRRGERTTSLSHRILRDDMRVVLDSANRRLTELAHEALRTSDVAIGSGTQTKRSYDGRLRGPRLGWAVCSAAADSVRVANTERERACGFFERWGLTETAAS